MRNEAVVTEFVKMHSDKTLTVFDLITFLVLALLIIVLFEFAALAGQWLPAAGGDGAWAARTGSGPMLMRGDIFAASRGGGAGCGRQDVLLSSGLLLLAGNVL